MNLFDTHCHLASEEFEENLDQVLSDCAKAGVNYATIIATDLDDGRRALELSRRKKQIKLFATLGLHPHEAKYFDQDFADALTKEIADYVAVGETGLDYHYDFAPKEIQKENFAFHIELAARVKKPLVIHCRESVEDIYSLLSSKKSAFSSHPGIMHCFAETWEWGKKFLDLGLYLSFSGIITFKNADSLRESVRNAPLDRILIETDSPYLAPVPFRGKKNSPAYVVKTFEQICQLRNEDAATIEAALLANSLKIFNLG